MNKNPNHYDVIIIGGGVAGMSAALWCDDLKLSALMLEQSSELGGQLLKIYNPIKNHLGVEAANGKILRDIFLAQIEKREFAKRLQAKVIEVDVENKRVVTESGDEFSAKAVIIATGVRRRKLNIENEDFYQGKGILESGTNERETAAGKTVMIVGGGDAAIENALILAEKAAKVYVVHRRKEFRARTEFIEQAKANEKIEFLTETVVEKIIGAEKIEAIKLKNLMKSETKKMKLDYLLVRIGVQPNAELFRQTLDLDKSGYLQITADYQTNVKFVFAVGDVANQISPTISTAIGAGATSVKKILALLKF